MSGSGDTPVVPTSCRECPVLGGADIPARREEGQFVTLMRHSPLP